MPEENLMDIELNWCSFHVFIHGFPIRMMTREVVEYIGNMLGVFLDSEHVQTQFKWEAKVRIQVSLDVRNPLTRALCLGWMGGEDKIMVTFTYERLPNFCYGCGLLGHIMRDCKYQLEYMEGQRKEDLLYGP
ncbi:UNVERIFIED_CONTAM: hypothetical protein Slati_0938300 [Sesamum latifolium]|uniref:CCHC-type domain-containing protein n=1 Tax=Sesamum latifolium TaxID=2727402 RepID=A0AAW2XQJ3_9LAMI